MEIVKDPFRIRWIQSGLDFRLFLIPLHQHLIEIIECLFLSVSRIVGVKDPGYRVRSASLPSKKDNATIRFVLKASSFILFTELFFDYATINENYEYCKFTEIMAISP